MPTNMRSKYGLMRSAAFASVLTLGLTACSPMVSNHGYVPLDSEIDSIVPGRDTRSSIEEKLGSPTTSGTLGDDTIYYVASRFERVGPFAPNEIERRVVAISFNSLDVVSNVEEFGLEEGRVVALSRRVTDTGLSDVGLIQQLFGNLGNIQPGALVDG